jgi:hypothetical protein
LNKKPNNLVKQNFLAITSGIFVSLSTSIHFLQFWQRTFFVKCILILSQTILVTLAVLLVLRIIQNLSDTTKKVIIGNSVFISSIVIFALLSLNPHLPMPQRLLIIKVNDIPPGGKVILSKVSISEGDVPLYNLTREGNWNSSQLYGTGKQLWTESPGVLRYSFETEPQQYFTIKFISNQTGGHVTVKFDNITQELNLQSTNPIEMKVTGTLYHGEYWLGVFLVDFIACFFLVLSIITLLNTQLIGNKVAFLLKNTNFGLLSLLFTAILSINVIPVSLGVISSGFAFLITLIVSYTLGLSVPHDFIINKVLNHKFLIVFFLFAIVALAAIPLIGWYSRYVHDDFLSAVDLRNGPWFLIKHMYFRLFGRFSYILLMSHAYLFSPYYARVLPVLSLFLLWLLVTKVCQTVVHIIGEQISFLHAGLISLVFCGTFLFLSPNIAQSFYWMVGNLLYFSPYIFLTTNVYLFIKSTNTHNLMLDLLLIITSFLIGGFTEPLAIALIVFALSTYILLRPLIKNSPSIRKPFLLMSFGWIVGGCLSLLSPGVINRLHHNSAVAFDILPIINRIISVPIKFLSDRIQFSPLIFGFLILIALLFGKRYLTKICISTFIRITIILTASFWSTFVISALIGDLPGRAYTTSTFFLILLVASFGFLLSKITVLHVPYPNTQLALSYLLIITLVGTTFWGKYISNKDQLRNFANAWDITYQELLMQQKEGLVKAKVSLDPSLSFDLGEMGSMHTSEKDLLRYYGFTDIQFPGE